MFRQYVMSKQYRNQDIFEGFTDSFLPLFSTVLMVQNNNLIESYLKLQKQKY